MEQMNKTICIYCDGEIITKDFGWGYFIEDRTRTNFHLECAQQIEDLRLGPEA